jgi:putative redox protein
MPLLEVTFPEGKKTKTNIKGFTVYTDQPKDSGGDETNPTPFDMYFVALATCTGVTALSFCQVREISTEGLKVALDHVRDPETRMVTNVTLEVTLPEGFPEKYQNAIKKSLDQCTVKKHILNPPAIETIVK